MDTAERFRSHPLWLTEGSVVERLRRGGPLPLDPELVHGAFVLTSQGRGALRRIYTEYLDIALFHRLPLLLFTPTWRTTGERTARAGLPPATDLNGEGVRFLRDLLEGRPSDQPSVLVGGLMGCRGDAYRPEEGLARQAAAQFHLPQAEALAAGGADFLFASTLPALPEALGLAEAMAATGLPYALSLLPRPDGRLLDGTPLEEGVARLEGAAPTPPLFLAANCTYPTALGSALSASAGRGADLRGSLAGLQANGSALPPEALDGLDHLDAEPPEAFAAAMVGLRREWGLSVLGGCCGTDGRHIGALAKALAGAP